MTDDEYLALFRAASPKAQRQAITIGLALLEFIKRKKTAKRHERFKKYHRDFIATINKIMGGDA